MTVEIFSISVFQFHITHSVWPPKCQILFVGMHIPKSISQQELMQNLGQTEWNMGNCYISQLVRTLWLANLAGHTLLYGLLNSKVCFSHHAKWKSTLHTWVINPRGKNLVRNLQYGPPTRLVRAIYKMRTTEKFVCVLKTVDWSVIKWRGKFTLLQSVSTNQWMPFFWETLLLDLVKIVFQ